MGRVKKFGKGKFFGNRYTKKKEDVNICIYSVNSSCSSLSTPRGNPCDTVVTPSSASRKKLFSSELGDNNLYSEFSVNSVHNVNNERMKTGFLLSDLSVLSQSVKCFVKCKHCDGEDCVYIVENTSKLKGLASQLVLACENCQEEQSFVSSKKIQRT